VRTFNLVFSEAVQVALAIVGVAVAVVLVSSKNTSSIIGATGNAFSGSLRAALGH
jgi:hypothetical protein